MENKIRKSLIDKNVETLLYNPQLVANEYSKNILTTIKSNLGSADRIDIAVSYVVWSGFSLLKDSLKKFDSRSRIIVTTEGLVTDPSSLRGLLSLDLDVRVYNPYSNSRGFHLKSYLFEKKDISTLLIGSNNISSRALGMVHELAVEVDSSNEGYILEKYDDIFNNLWIDNSSVELTEEFIRGYEITYNFKREMEDTYSSLQLEENKIRPNYMQKMALIELEQTRKETTKGLVIAATGTGKTYLSAFDVENANAKKVLFLVHNRLILNDAVSTYKRVFRNKNIIQLFSSNQEEIESADIIFTTDKTAFSILMNNYPKDYFDYIVYDEAHKIGEETNYKEIISYFEPNFSLGITATPERTDNPKFLFEIFDYNVVYEIRLLDAMNSELVCPFNYYGYHLEESLLDSNEKFKYDELSKYLKEIIKDKGHYGQKLKALFFTSSIQEAEELTVELNKIGFNAKSAVSGSSTNDEIEEDIRSLQSNNEGSVEIICTVNKFNEGVDIPEVNVIVMLRNTTSSIVYLQQLGRGLRRTNDPHKFVTVFDIIGNSNNNYSIAEVLTGNTTRDKKQLLKSANEGFNFVSPFINVDIEEKAMESIIKSISNNFTVKAQLKKKFKEELSRFSQIPTLLELYLNPNFNELELLQLSYKNFHEPFDQYYFEKYNIEKDNLFVRNFFTLIMQFVFRGYSNDMLEEYTKVLNGGSSSNEILTKVLLPKQFENGITSAINSNYHSISSNYPNVFLKDGDSIKLDQSIEEHLKINNSYNLFLEHIELIDYLCSVKQYSMETFDLVDKGEFLFNVGAKDCYMNVVGEKIDHDKKSVYCTIKVTKGESHYDNHIIDNDKIVYYTQSSTTKKKAEEKVIQFLEEDYKFYICAIFPHLGYSNTSYFNLGNVVIESISEVQEINSKKYNHEIIFKLENTIPKELLIYKD